MRLLERFAYLAEQIHRAVWRERPKALDQCLNVNAVQQLHHEEERTILRDAKIVQVDGVRRTE
jgi:hypothetical protein